MDNYELYWEELGIGAELLYELVEFTHLKKEQLPYKEDLVKIALHDLGMNLSQAKNCVAEMEAGYLEKLMKMKYFSWQRT